MAVTEQLFTGNGSATNFSFTFPYLKETDLAVQVDSVVTTAWSLANATTVQFNTAPANGAKIRILRDTDVDNLTATFHAGSAIKSEDLNDNFTQNLFVTQEVTGRSFQNTGLSVMTGDLQMGEDTSIVFEGATDNAHETKLSVTDPTADRTITLPNVTGTVVTTGDENTVTRTMIADTTIQDGQIAGDAEIAVSKLKDGSANQVLVTSSGSGDDVQWSSSLDLPGTLEVTSTATFNNDVDIDTNLNVDGNAVFQSDVTINADNKTFKVQNNSNADKFTIDTDNGNTVIKGTLEVEGNVTLGTTSFASGKTISLPDDTVDTDAIEDKKVTYAKIQDVTATDRILGRDSSGAGIIEEITPTNLRTMINVENGATADQTAADIKALLGANADSKITSAEIKDDTIGKTQIGADRLKDLVDMHQDTADKLSANTALTATITNLNILTNKSIDTAIAADATDSDIPTSEAVNERIVGLVSEVGGFVPIANETSFPASNPDVDDAAGTIVSIKALSSAITTGSGVTTKTIANGAGSGNTVTINGLTANTTYPAGRGMLLETTSTTHTYTFHRLTLDETGVADAQSAIDSFNQRYKVQAGEPSSGTNAGDLVFDTSANKMKVRNTDNSSWGEVTSSGDFKFLVAVDAGTSTAATFDGSDTNFDLKEATNNGSAASVTSVNQLIVVLNGVVQKPNAGTTISGSDEGFCLVDSDTIKFATAPASGSSCFIVQMGSAVSIPTPGNNTITDAMVKGTAAIAGSKINPDFGTQDLTIADKIIHSGDTNTAVRFPAADTVSVETGGSERLRITSDGKVGIGTTSPDFEFQVEDSSGAAVIRAKNGSDNHICDLVADSTGGLVRTIGNQPLRFDTNQVERMRLDTSGNVGIGTNSPEASGIHIHKTNARLQLTDGTTGSASGDGIIFGLNGSQDFFINNRETDKKILFFTENTERMRISQDGEVAIGSDSAVSPLNVRAMADGNLHVRPITSIHSGTGVGLDILNNDNSAVQDLAIRAVNTVFRDATAEVARFTSDGLKVPSGKGIDFSSTSDAGGMTSELLDDYEEGTWEPVVTPGTNSFGSITMHGDTGGSYTKIGNSVRAMGCVRWTACDFSASSGNMRISLPFTGASRDNGDNADSLSITRTSAWNGSLDPRGVQVSHGSAQLNVFGADLLNNTVTVNGEMSSNGAVQFDVTYRV